MAKAKASDGAEPKRSPSSAASPPVEVKAAEKALVRADAKMMKTAPSRADAKMAGKASRPSVGSASPHDAQAEPSLHEKRTARVHVDADLEKIVQMPTWREVLLAMVAEQRLDPWNIDVVEIANRYLERLRQMEMEDLRVPANLILAAAILLRFKSDMLSLAEPIVQSTLGEFDSFPDDGMIPALELKGRVPPLRRVTLDELVGAMEKVFEDQRIRSTRVVDIPLPPSLEIKLAEFNIDDHIRSVQEKIIARKDSEGLVTFSALLDEKTRPQVIYTLLPLLFLSQKGAVSLVQDPFFGEIFIRALQAPAPVV